MSTTDAVNTILLVGRVSTAPESRTMPSGDELVQFRVVVPRPRVKGDRRAQVDAIDIACWSARSRGSALRLDEGDTVEVEGSLRRRFFAGATGRVSRYEVEARRLRRVARRA
jgi:single-strand DNA-binding protein